MFRIRRIYDDILPVDRGVIAQAQNILRTQFPLISEEVVKKLPEQLRNPLKYRFRSILFVAEGAKGIADSGLLLLHRHLYAYQ
jgi:hypothetical protein